MRRIGHITTAMSERPISHPVPSRTSASKSTIRFSRLSQRSHQLVNTPSSSFAPPVPKTTISEVTHIGAEAMHTGILMDITTITIDVSGSIKTDG